MRILLTNALVFGISACMFAQEPACAPILARDAEGKLTSLCAPPEQTACFMGVVTDENGNPRAGAEVQAHATDGSKGFGGKMSGLNGQFKFYVRSGVYDVSVKPAFRDSGKYNQMVVHETVVVSTGCHELSLKLVHSAVLVVHGRDGATGQELGSLRVSIEPSLPYMPLEIYKPVDVLSGADLKLRAGKPGYEPTELRVQALRPGETKELEITLLPAIAGCLKGRVDDEQNHPMAGAVVFANPNSAFRGQGSATKSASDGTFKMNLAPGAYTVHSEQKSDGYVADWQDGVQVAIASSSQCEEASLTLGPKTAWISVRVVSAKTQASVWGDVEITRADTGGKGYRVIRNQDPPPIAVPPNTQMTVQLQPVSKKERPEAVTVPALQSGQTYEISLTRE